MLQIHEAMAVIHHTYPDQISDQGKNLMRNRFYHGLSPIVHAHQEDGGVAAFAVT